MTDVKSWWWFEKHFLPPQMKNVYPRDNPIDYKVNTYGYRCPEFEDIDWSNSNVIFGASYVFGEGVLENETISYYLEEQLKEPVINLGFSAASNQHVLLCMSMLAKKFKPKKWIIGYLDSSRWLHWDVSTTDPVKVQAHRGPHKNYRGDPFPQLVDSLGWYSSQARVSMQAITKGNCVEFGFRKQIDPDWNVKTFDLVDEGRVPEHPGPKTNKMIADWIYEEIRKS